MKNLVSCFVTLISLVVSGHVQAVEWAYCSQNNRNFNDSADWICDIQSVEEFDTNYKDMRCKWPIARYCRATSGGDISVRGPHNVPTGGWFVAEAITEKYDEFDAAWLVPLESVRCMCY